jgi:hypothetical protein
MRYLGKYKSVNIICDTSIINNYFYFGKNKDLYFQFIKLNQETKYVKFKSAFISQTRMLTQSIFIITETMLSDIDCVVSNTQIFKDYVKVYEKLKQHEELL